MGKPNRPTLLAFCLTTMVFVGWGCSSDNNANPSPEQVSGETGGSAGSGGQNASGSGGTASTSGTGGASPNGSGGGGNNGTVTQSLEIKVTAALAEEKTVCTQLALNNDKPMMLRGLRSHLAPGSHHLIVTRAPSGTVPDNSLSECGAFAHAGDSIFIAQKQEDSLAYPDGTGLKLEPHQVIGLEMHYINYLGQDNADISGIMDFDMVPVGEAPLKEVSFLFTGSLSIFLPPHEKTTVTDEVTVPQGAKIFALTSHTHQYGTYASIHRTTNSTAGELLHESKKWSEPPLSTFSPAISLAPAEKLLLTCEYFNSSNSAVTFGTGFNDEMCFLWVHYYKE
jgi:hypothetical protein